MRQAIATGGAAAPGDVGVIASTRRDMPLFEPERFPSYILPGFCAHSGRERIQRTPDGEEAETEASARS